VDEKLRTHPVRQCPHCGKDVVSRGYQVKRYCNNICYQRYQRAKTKKVRQQINCKECNKPFVPKRDNHFRCSDRCRRISEARYFKQNRSRYQKTKESFPCQFCGQLFVPSHYLITFCSKSCKRQHEAKWKEKPPAREPDYRKITEDDLKTSNHAKEILEFKNAGGQVKVYPTLPGPKIPNTGTSKKGGSVDAEWSVKDIADLDEYEDVFNMKN
jgi:endogenous inhibitor of DNA gyrase (YacG/DUF329 family)